MDYLFASLAQGTHVQIPWGDLCETGILLLALSRYIVFFTLTYVWEILALLHGDFGMNSYNDDSNKAIKRYGVKHFIASIFQKHEMLHRFIAPNSYSAFNSSSSWQREKFKM